MAFSASSRTYDQVKEEIHQLLTSSLLPSIDAGLTLTELCQEYENLDYETLSRFLGSMKRRDTDVSQRVAHTLLFGYTEC